MGPQHAYHPHELELCVLEHGVEMARIGANLTRTVGGQYDFVPAATEHSSWTTTQAVVELVIHLPTRRIQEVAEEMGMRGSPKWNVGPYTTPPELKALLEALKCETAHADAAGHSLVFSSLATSLCAMLLRLHASPPRTECLDAATAGQRHIGP